MEGAGPGLEMTLSMRELLPSGAELTIHCDHAALSDGKQEVVMETPAATLLRETSGGGTEPCDALVVRASDTLLMAGGEGGPSVTLLSPRTSPPRT